MQNLKQTKCFSNDGGIVDTKSQSKTSKVFVKAEFAKVTKADIAQDKKLLGVTSFIG